MTYLRCLQWLEPTVPPCSSPTCLLLFAALFVAHYWAFRDAPSEFMVREDRVFSPTCSIRGSVLGRLKLNARGCLKGVHAVLELCVTRDTS